MLSLVTLKILTKSITTLIRGKGGKCVLTITMSELTGNTASVSILLQLLVAHSRQNSSVQDVTQAVSRTIYVMDMNQRAGFFFHDSHFF